MRARSLGPMALRLAFARMGSAYCPNLLEEFPETNLVLMRRNENRSLLPLRLPC